MSRNGAYADRPALDIAGTLGIICGGGRLPIDVAAAAQARGLSVFMIAIAGEADKAVEAYPHAWLRLGEVGRLFQLLAEQNCHDLVIIGKVSRPRLKDIHFDFGAVRALPRFLAMLAGGDDQILKKVVAYLDEKGINVHGAHDIAPDLLADAGRLGRVAPSQSDLLDVEIGLKLIEVLGAFDIGQAVVVENAHVLAVEAAEGTDAMMARVAALRQQRERGGVLVKRSKPGQELRVDMATVGVDTIAALKTANLAGLVVEAGRTILADREAMIRAADEAGLFIHSVTPGHD